MARFNNWKIFHVPKGFPNTKNPIESFNKIVKLIYTNYTVVSINELLKILTKKLVNFLSVQLKEFKYYREFTKTMIKKAKNLSENSFTRYDASSYWYHKQESPISRNLSTINTLLIAIIIIYTRIKTF